MVIQNIMAIRLVNKSKDRSCFFLSKGLMQENCFESDTAISNRAIC